MGYSRDQLRSALLAADKAGDTASAQRIAAEISATDAQAKAPAQDNRPTSHVQGFFEALTPFAASAQRAMDYVNPANILARTVVNAVAPKGRGGAPLLPSPTQQVQLRQQQAANAPVRGSWQGRLAGSVVGSAPTLAIPGSGVGALALQGGASGAMGTEDPTNLKQLGMNTALGAVTAPIGNAITSKVAKTVGGAMNPALKILTDEGITVTPGMRGGPNSTAQFVEDKVLGSLPFLNAIPDTATKASFNDLRHAVANRVLAPIGESIPKGTQINSDAISGIQDTVHGAYQKALGNLNLDVTPELVNDLAAVHAQSPLVTTADGAGQVAANIQDILGRMAQKPLSGQTLRETMSNLRGVASKNAGTGVGDQLWAVHDALANALEQQNSGHAVEAFTNARTSEALLKRLEAAAGKPAVMNGEFGPTQLKQAVEQRGYGVSTPSVAAAEAPMQDLSNAAAQVMRNKTANSGTVPRATALGLLTEGAGGYAALHHPLMAGAVGMSLLGYIPPIANILQQMAVNRPQVMQDAGALIQSAAPYVGRLSAGPAVGLFGQ